MITRFKCSRCQEIHTEIWLLGEDHEDQICQKCLSSWEKKRKKLWTALKASNYGGLQWMTIAQQIQNTYGLEEMEKNDEVD